MLNLRARQYEPGVMRFSQRDVWHGMVEMPTSQNRYLYCVNEPVGYYDRGGDRFDEDRFEPKKVKTSTSTEEVLPSFGDSIQKLRREQLALQKIKTENRKLENTLAIAGIDINNTDDSTRRAIEEAKKEIAVKAAGGTLTASEHESIINTVCYKSYWARNDGYFSGNWWQDKTKLIDAARMLQLEAKSLDGLNGYSLSYQKMFALQALAGINRSGVYDAHTQEYLSRILNIDAYDFETAYSNYSPEQIAYLIDRNQDGIAGTGFGNFWENGGREIFTGLTILFFGWLFENIRYEEPISNASGGTGNNLPEGWTRTDNNGFTHIKDADGNIRIRIDPPDAVTNYPHQHFYDEFGNSLDINGNIVDYRSPNAHIPLP